MKSLVSLTLVQFCYRNSGPPGNNPGDFLVCHCLMNKRQVFFLYLVLFLFQLFLKLRQASVLKFCRFIQIIFPLCLLNIPVDLLDLFPDLLDTFHGSLLILPLNFLIRVLILQFCKLLLQMFQTFPAEPVFFFLQRLFLNLQLHDTPPQFIQLRGHGIQLRLNQRAGLIHQVNGLVRKETV